jgi:hypothetical protein
MQKRREKPQVGKYHSAGNKHRQDSSASLSVLPPLTPALRPRVQFCMYASMCGVLVRWVSLFSCCCADSTRETYMTRFSARHIPSKGPAACRPVNIHVGDCFCIYSCECNPLPGLMLMVCGLGRADQPRTAGVRPAERGRRSGCGCRGHGQNV